VSRITTTALVFLILLNGAVGIMEASGLADDMGVTLAPGVDTAMEDTIDNAKQGFSANGGFGATLFGLIAASISLTNTIVSGVFAFPTFVLNIGVPAWIVAPLFAPMYVVAVFEIIFVATGRDLV